MHGGAGQRSALGFVHAWLWAALSSKNEDGIEPLNGSSLMADALHALVSQDPKTCTGEFFIDEEILARVGITDLSGYDTDPNVPPMPDLFVDTPDSPFTA